MLDASVSSSVATALIPEHIYISDCIILSAPLEATDVDGYDGLSVVVMRAIQLSHYFLKAGYLIRGGISIGKTWHTQSNIVGPAYQEAYSLEHCGNEPIVVLSESAAEWWRKHSYKCFQIDSTKSSQVGLRMCLKRNGKVIVNGLFDQYIADIDQHGKIEEVYGNYANLAGQMLKKELPESALEKWAWFKDFLESESSEGSKWAQA